MYNLGTVLRFEIFRALKKPTFWIAIFAIPVIYGVMFMFGAISGSQAKENQEKLAKESFSFQVQDESGLISKELVLQLKGSFSNDKQKAIESVKNGKLSAFYFIPKDLTSEKVEIYGKNTNINENGKYSAVLKTILKNSGVQATNKNQLALINETYKTEQTFFKNGEKYNQFPEMIVPGIF